MKLSEKPPYKIGDTEYSRRAGRKTLVFVAICILFVVILTISSIFLLFNTKTL